ncbi:MAG: FHA domain-containing protein [Bacteroidia bacterium]
MKTVFTIGADSSNDIVLTGKYIEAFHARIDRKGDEYYLLDISQHFGVTINNDRITESTLLNGKKNVKISTHVFHWQDEIEDVINPKTTESTDFYFSDFLQWKGTLDCKTYRYILLLGAISPILVFPGVHAIVSVFGKIIRQNLQPIVPFVWILCFALIGYVLVAQSIKRANSTGLEKWKFFIPGYNLYLLLFKK